jgi:ATP-binding cassette, subfamily B, multidrug efflux pump
MQALIQYARQFAQPLTHLASMAATFQSGIASLERVLELLDAEESRPSPPTVGRPDRCAGASCSTTCTSRTTPTAR